jgi:hypothetical protein
MEQFILASLATSSANLIIDMCLRRIETATYRFTKSTNPEERLKLATELSYLTDIISTIQAQLNEKVDTSKW